MHFVHFYPFPIFGPYGGAIRLKAAVEASRLIGHATVLVYDRLRAVWRELPDEGYSAARSELRSSRRKRSIFPSTLFESGRLATRDLGSEQIKALPRPHVAILHTSYLAPLIGKLRPSSSRIVLDMHDLVWRAHRIDATAASGPLSAIRGAYAWTVAKRENHAVRLADMTLVAGWRDYELARVQSGTVAWVPTPIKCNLVPRREPDGFLNVGLIGNFDHYPTAAMAERLLASNLGSDPFVRIILGGLNSERYRDSGRNVTCLGPVPQPEVFYRCVDCVVAFVVAGSGAKIKVAEGVMAGRLVITSDLGADGLPPRRRRHVDVVPSLDVITRMGCLDRINAWSTDAAAGAFASEVGWRVGVDRYAALLS